MGLTRSQKDAELAELYAMVPTIPDCDGRCWRSCGPIDMSDRERQRTREAGAKISGYREAMEARHEFYCEALTADKRCSIYDSRPMICRLWGTTIGMPCPFGCVPEGGYLTDDEGYALIVASLEIGGHELARRIAESGLNVVGNEEFRKLQQRLLERGRRGDLRRIVPDAYRKEGS
jgi:hypothetical protein